MSLFPALPKIALPQAPRGRVVALGNRFDLPGRSNCASTHVRNEAAARRLRTGSASSIASLEQLVWAVSGESRSPFEAPPAFHDELDPFIAVEPVDPARELAKAKAEFAVYSRMVDRIPALIGTSLEDFLAMLLEVHRRLGAGSNAWRLRPVGLRPDAAGNCVLFPGHQHCRPLLANLHAYLAANSCSEPLPSACAAFVTVLYAHPFEDGNGRTARVFYNLVLASALGTRHFVPIAPISAINRGSFLIKLRRTLYGGDWEPLQAFFASAVQLSCDLQASSVEPPMSHSPKRRRKT